MSWRVVETSREVDWRPLLVDMVVREGRGQFQGARVATGLSNCMTVRLISRHPTLLVCY